MLEIKNLTKKFGGVVALDRVNLTLEENETKGIIGPNGSGKTTLINIISGYLKPTEGEVLFNGVKICGKPPEKIASLGIGRVFQITNLFNGLTVHENIWMAALRRTKFYGSMFKSASQIKDVEQSVEEVLKLIGLSSKSDFTVSQCSYGEQRLVEIGMVLALDPGMMLLDEPTSGLSLGEKQRCIDVIKNISKRKALLIIEHSMEVIAQLVKNATVLYQGKVIAEGELKELLQDEEIRKIYLGG
ncbi:MAG: ABC transporter ATP-binding protein [Candidatus Bathyarchaeia archaeon]